MRTWSTTFAAATVLAGTVLIPSSAGSAHAAEHATGHGAQHAAGPGAQRATVRAGGHASGPPTPGACASGQLCLWGKPDFKGAKRTHELSTLDINSCTALPAGTTAQSLVNRTGRPVTTYQSAECAETGEFQTYPGDGVWLPQSPYQVRAFKVWER
ncbi:peptidase inhibitor family I36 protein [Streptomyces sp. CJ_13]|uniref:peptidase inhibitor family I36 protein n=1 Tax=Streptomyces sp. CJ_13 TaxID=2724943 RepID=UPI001BDC0E96|nr:peptidase inhibitor family I36 protein [Streptomyces sp. CJ_13]MBT1184381.1 peptidase inhibitor family I36 protein [Streptomyces sp. CJ_13]